MLTRLHILDRFSVLGRESREVRQYMPQNPFEGPRIHPQEAVYAMQRLQMEAQRRAMMLPQGYPQMLQQSPMFPMQIAQMAQMYGPQYRQWGPVNAVNFPYDIGARLPYMPFQYQQMMRPASPVYFQQLQRPMLAAYPMQNFGYNQPQFAPQYYQRYWHPVYRPPYQVWRPQQMYPQAPAFRPSYAPVAPSRPAPVPAQQYGRQTPMFVSPSVPRPAVPSYTQSPSVQYPPMTPPLTNAEWQQGQASVITPEMIRRGEQAQKLLADFRVRLMAEQHMADYCRIDELRGPPQGPWTIRVTPNRPNAQPEEMHVSLTPFPGASIMTDPMTTNGYRLYVSFGSVTSQLPNSLDPQRISDVIYRRLVTQQQVTEKFQKMNEAQEKMWAEAERKERAGRVAALGFDLAHPLAIRIPLVLPEATMAGLRTATGQPNPYILVDYSLGNEPRISIPRLSGQPWTHSQVVIPSGVTAAQYFLNQPADLVRGNLQMLTETLTKAIGSVVFS